MTMRKDEDHVVSSPSGPHASEGDATKAKLQRRVEDARESISSTVEEIRDTVEDQYASVKATVTGLLDWRDQLHQNPIVWSVGALSAGFALGYTLGFAQKTGKPTRRRGSGVGRFADSLVAELSTLAKSLPLSALDGPIKTLLGFELSELLREIAGPEPAAGRPRSPKKAPARKLTTRKVPARRKTRARHARARGPRGAGTRGRR
jgi:hypothetical protein